MINFSGKSTGIDTRFTIRASLEILISIIAFQIKYKWLIFYLSGNEYNNKGPVF